MTLQQQLIEQNNLIQKQQQHNQQIQQPFISSPNDIEMDNIKKIQALAENTALPDEDDDFDDI